MPAGSKTFCRSQIGASTWSSRSSCFRTGAYCSILRSARSSSCGLVGSAPVYTSIDTNVSGLGLAARCLS